MTQPEKKERPALREIVDRAEIAEMIRHAPSMSANARVAHERWARAASRAVMWLGVAGVAFVGHLMLTPAIEAASTRYIQRDPIDASAEAALFDSLTAQGEPSWSAACITRSVLGGERAHFWADYCEAGAAANWGRGDGS